MSGLDDPQEQIARHSPADEGPVGPLVAGLAVVAIGVLTRADVGATLATLFGLAVQTLGSGRQKQRVEALRDGFWEGLGTVIEDVERVEARLADLAADPIIGPQIEEAALKAIRITLEGASLEKARRLGRVLGATLRDDDARWRDATEFIQQVEDLTEDDQHALRLIWKMQRPFVEQVAPGRRELKDDAALYRKSWKETRALAESFGFSLDDWQARCSRLAGFGLAVPIPPPMGMTGGATPTECYRLTGRAVRFLGLLGRNTDPGAYPAHRYHPTLGNKIVADDEEDAALGDGWSGKPLS